MNKENIGEEKLNNLYLTTKHMEETFDSTLKSFEEDSVKTETRKYSKDPRKAKIQKLKEQIKAAEDSVVSELPSINVEEEMKLTPKEQEAKKKSFKDMLELNKVNIKALKEELKLTRMNKNSSPFFQWLPTLANRRMRRAARKLRKV